MASAFSASMRGVRLLAGSLTRAPAKFFAAAMIQPFASQFAAFGKLAQQACGGLIDFRDTALNGVRFFKYARNQGFGIECCKRLGLQRDLHGALSPPIVVHGLFDFPASFLGAFVLAAVPRLLALRQGDFDLGDAVTKIDLQRDDGQTLGLGASGKLVNFAPVKDKLASAQSLVVPTAARYVLCNVSSNEP